MDFVPNVINIAKSKSYLHMHLVGHEPITSPPVSFLLGEEVPLELELIGKYNMMTMMDSKALGLIKKKIIKY